MLTLNICFCFFATGSRKPLSDRQINTLRSRLSGLKMLIIDEISFVGRKTFSYVDDRLREILGIDQPFGGVHVIAVGDFNQLSPVLDSYVFTSDENNIFSAFVGTVNIQPY